MTATSQTYAEKDAIRQPIEWDGLNCVMLGTRSAAGIVRRMDGCPVTVPTENHRHPLPERLAAFATSGQWLFDA
jgi:hypothetical protein